MVSSILPKHERWDNFQYIKSSQRSGFGRIKDTIICFRDCLTFSMLTPNWMSQRLFLEFQDFSQRSAWFKIKKKNQLVTYDFWLFYNF